MDRGRGSSLLSCAKDLWSREGTLILNSSHIRVSLRFECGEDCRESSRMHFSMVGHRDLDPCATSQKCQKSRAVHRKN